MFSWIKKNKIKKIFFPVWQLTSKENLPRSPCITPWCGLGGRRFQRYFFSSGWGGVTGSLQVAAGWNPAELHIPHTNPPDFSFARLLKGHCGKPDHCEAKSLAEGCMLSSGKIIEEVNSGGERKSNFKIKRKISVYLSDFSLVILKTEIFLNYRYKKNAFA